MTRSVLFVDDEPNVLQGLRRILRGARRDWAMVFVDSGEAALRELETITEHSMKTARLAKAIARHETMPTDQVDAAFMAGLLHDLGKLVLAHNLPVHYGALLQVTLDKDVPIQDAEMALFGATHEQIGAYLAGLWGLPDAIDEAVAFHHSPERCPARVFDTVGVVHVADELARVDACKDGIRTLRLSTAYVQRLGLADRLAEWVGLIPGPAA